MTVVGGPRTFRATRPRPTLRHAHHRRHHPDAVTRRLTYPVIIGLSLAVLIIFLACGRAGWGCSTRLGAAWIATSIFLLASMMVAGTVTRAWFRERRHLHTRPVRKQGRDCHLRLAFIGMLYVILHAICAVVHP